MNKNLLVLMEERMPEFSKGQKRIARYILDHYDKAAYMTASRLGSIVEVSESTVVRFAIEVGFDGYPELQKHLQELVKSHLTSVQRMEVAANRMGGDDIINEASSVRMMCLTRSSARMRTRYAARLTR